MPTKGESTPPLVMPKQAPKKRESSKARRERRSAEIFDETFAKKEQTDPTLHRIVVAGAATLTIVLLAGVLWPRNQGSSDSARDSAVLPEDLIELPERKSRDLTADSLSPALVQNQLLPVIEEFLNTTSLKEASELCRRPTRTLQRMKRVHPDKYYPPGLRAILSAKPMVREGDWALLQVEDMGFQQRPIALLFEDTRWKVDWESWAGWSEMDLPTLKQEKPTTPVLLRVRLRETDYYNFDFKDESKWSSYQLSDPDLLETIYGYVPSLGELDLRLRPGPDVKELKVALRVRYPEAATSDNQLIIEEIVSDSWLVKEDTP